MNFKDIANDMEKRSANMTPERALKLCEDWVMNRGEFSIKDVTTAEAIAVVEFISTGVFRVEDLIKGNNADLKHGIQAVLTGFLLNIKGIDTAKATIMAHRFSVDKDLVVVTWGMSKEVTLLTALKGVLEDGTDIPEEDVRMKEEDLFEDLPKELKELMDLINKLTK